MPKEEREEWRKRRQKIPMMKRKPPPLSLSTGQPCLSPLPFFADTNLAFWTAGTVPIVLGVFEWRVFLAFFLFDEIPTAVGFDSIKTPNSRKKNRIP